MNVLNLLIILGSLAFLMFMAYRGHSVILFAPIAALLAVILTVPANTLPIFSGLFMAKMVTFIQNYFPIFLLGALFGKLMEVSGFARSIASAVIKLVGPTRSIISVVLVGAILTYGGVSLFVAVFAVYPFAAEMFRQADIPKRLIPATIALGAFAFTMDALPGTPQIQNIIPTTYFKTTSFAAPSWAPSAACSSSGSASPTWNGVAGRPPKRARGTATGTSTNLTWSRWRRRRTGAWRRFR